ncbi:MAG: hypothetical protein A3D64_01185 [Candidatus Wildermuthbacteria bacterium RIFCSPHIGHO2_02_FULL_49_9]|uniref:HTH deoR-type domain-containing protein n=1 Tax=Candidatus Wildermuthbacteria bacterium RIFCSPHIGHO2_02_FULL_49_9 TaxID=1802456 RepID=A0A1G2REY2_9BACT|nr:MAG: hypothetical protein A3D64_01185 [Candidatus Wildermuthbacteria bacterium RIFCSPHIGHO2_02_FULL_49_9]
MTLDFLVRLTLAAHKVAGILQKDDALRTQLQDSANRLLESWVLLVHDLATPEQKRQTAAKAVKELGMLVTYLNYARRMSRVNPKNFVVLEREYNKVGEFLRQLHQGLDQDVRPRRSNIPDVRSPKGKGNTTLQQGILSQGILSGRRETKENSSPLFPQRAKEGELSPRQNRILQLLHNKDKTQVWELKKVLPEVTKRTLRRDLDDLLQRNLIVRQGEWNEVFYQIH